ncbi:hypothetical protein DXU92_03525 [Brachybacterium saurashtrense]|uniref:Uncharacterized protein n=1 Tax=Brachybacterium saurashtrense TaxID=556288 RepID=A0A345YQL7_9MICO|nr:hypothetical protein DWV08_11775 [Brachybacterium saurashtrense]RRR23959.1 hypothetical protein DXU92_03525 [Brachybacterium saurashtrense]
MHGAERPDAARRGGRGAAGGRRGADGAERGAAAGRAARLDDPADGRARRCGHLSIHSITVTEHGSGR